MEAGRRATPLSKNTTTWQAARNSQAHGHRSQESSHVESKVPALEAMLTHLINEPPVPCGSLRWWCDEVSTLSNL